MLATASAIAITYSFSPQYAFAQAPTNEALYRMIVRLEAEQDKLRQQNARFQAETARARDELRKTQE